MKMKKRAEAPCISGVLHLCQPHEDCIPLFRTPYGSNTFFESLDSTRFQRVSHTDL